MRWLADVKVKKCSAVGIQDPVVHGLDVQIADGGATTFAPPKHRSCQSSQDRSLPQVALHTCHRPVDRLEGSHSYLASEIIMEETRPDS